MPGGQRQMIKSMTGFAAVTREDERATIAVTIRSLNHRYLDLQLRVPQSLAAIESDVRGLVGKRVSRGRVELSLSLQLRQTPGVEVEFNEEFGRALEAALDQARDAGLVTGALTPGDLLRLPQALTIRERQTDADETARAELAARAREAVDAGARRARHDARRAKATTCAPTWTRAGRSWPTSSSASPSRPTRAGRRWSSGSPSACASCGPSCRPTRRPSRRRSSARRRGRTSARKCRGSAAHVSHWVTLADSAEPCGRKLDFLLQEMNREVNTMGSKADGLRVSELDHRGQGRAREDARAGPECRVRPSTGPAGLLFIVSAPSGAGKTTLVERLVEQVPRLKLSRSYTSRPARAGRDRRRGL